jgi:hypothetical protein
MDMRAYETAPSWCVQLAPVARAHLAPDSDSCAPLHSHGFHHAPRADRGATDNADDRAIVRTIVRVRAAYEGATSVLTWWPGTRSAGAHGATTGEWEQGA